MREVSVRLLAYYVDLARTAGVDEAELLDGLPSVARGDAKQADWFDWDDFVEIVERFERFVGGPEGVGRAMRDALPTAYPDIRAFASVFVLPIPLFTFVMTRMMRTLYRHLDVGDIERLGGDRIRWVQTIPEPYRPCEAFHRGSVSLVELFPRHLDLEEARVERVIITPRTAELVVQFPPPDPLVVRGARAFTSVTSVLAAQFDAAFATIADALRTTPSDGAPAVGATDGWAERLELSPRQRDVFAMLAEGRSNKEIAAALRCSERNVEFHVGRIFRAARVSSRSELLVKVLAAPAP